MTRSSEEIKSLVENIGDVLKEHDEVLLAYLFGSYLRGPWTQRSDIDVGVYLTEQGLQNPWYPVELQEKLLKRIPGEHPFDVRVLNGASPKFLYEVIYHTPKIIVRDENLRVDFETLVLIEWYDMRITFETFRRERAEVLKQ